MRGTLHNCLLVCVLALTFAGCGSGDDGTIPPDEADNLLTVLDAVHQDVEDGNCDLAKEHAAEFISQVNELPDEVDNKVASELTKAADNLRELASTDCETGASGFEGVQPTDTTETDTTETDATEEATTVTEEEPEEEAEEPSTTDEEPTNEEPPEEPSPEPQGPPAGGGNVEPQGTPTPGGGNLEPPSGGVTPGGGG